MKAPVVIFIVLIAIIVLVAIIAVGLLWLGGSKSIAIPGLGVYFATPLLLVILIVIEGVLVFLAALSWRLSS